MLGRGIEFIRYLAILVLAPSKKAVGDIFFFLRQATAFKKKNSPPLFELGSSGRKIEGGFTPFFNGPNSCLFQADSVH